MVCGAVNKCCNCKCKRNAQHYDVVLRNGRCVSADADPNGYTLDMPCCNVGIIGSKIKAVTQKELCGDVVIDCTGLIITPGFVDHMHHATNLDGHQYKMAYEGITTIAGAEDGAISVDGFLDEMNRRGMALNYATHAAGLSPLWYQLNRRQDSSTITPVPFVFSYTPTSTDLWTVDIPSTNPVALALMNNTIAIFQENVARYPGKYNQLLEFNNLFTWYFGSWDPVKSAELILTPQEEDEYFVILEAILQRDMAGIAVHAPNQANFIVDWAAKKEEALATGKTMQELGAELSSMSKRLFALAITYDAPIIYHMSPTLSLVDSNLNTIPIYLDYIATLPTPGPKLCIIHTSFSGSGTDDTVFRGIIDRIEKMITVDGYTNLMYDIYPALSSGPLFAREWGDDIQKYLNLGVTPDSIIAYNYTPTNFGLPASVPAIFPRQSLGDEMIRTELTASQVWAAWQTLVPPFGTPGADVAIYNLYNQETIDYGVTRKNSVITNVNYLTYSGNTNARGVSQHGLFLRRYVRENHPPYHLSLVDAVRKLTTLPLKRFSVPEFEYKGQLREDYDADIVVWDLNTITDTSTISEPMLLTEGVKHVLVNGGLLMKDGVIDKKVLTGKSYKGKVFAPGRQKICWPNTLQEILDTPPAETFICESKDYYNNPVPIIPIQKL